MANTPRFTDSTTVVGKAPKDPWDNWANEAAARGAGMDMSRPGQLGNAWTDQFNPSGRGFGENYLDPVQNVYQGPINAQGQKVDEPFDPDYRDPQEAYDPDYKDPGPPPDYPGQLPQRASPFTALPTTLAPAIHPDYRFNRNPKTGMMTRVPWAAPKGAWMDDKGRVHYQGTPTLGTRFGRMVGGGLTGLKTPWRYVNAGLKGGAVAFKPLRIPLGVGGAVQGFTSSRPTDRIWQEGDERAPSAEDQALNDALNDPNRDDLTPNQATIASGRNAPNVSVFSSGGSPNTFHHTESGAGEYDPNWNPSGGQDAGPQPGTTTPPPATSTTPANPTAPAATTSTLPSAAPNPQGRVNPTTGEPDPNGILPQHMPGYQPPGQGAPGQPAGPALNTQEGTKAIQALYQKYYGRPATQGEVQAHWGNTGGIKAVEALLRADTKNHVPGAMDPTPPLGTGTPPGSPQEKAAIQAITGVPGAGGGGYSYAGFDFGQDPANRNIGKSAKYAFSYFAGQAAAQGAPQPRSKQEAEAWFKQYIAPGMNAQGFTVHKVIGDKAFISAPEHPNGAWVDFQGNSGGQGDQPLTWQAELGTGIDQDPEMIFAPMSDFGGGGGGGGDNGSGVGDVLDSGNPALNSFAKTLIERLLSGLALEDALESDKSKRQGISPESLKAVGF